MHDTDYYLLVKIFISQYLKMPEDTLSENTRLFHDLWIEGDEAVDLLNSFSRAFQVDMSAFIFKKYFNVEKGFRRIFFIFYFLFFKDKLLNTPLTLGDLARAAKEKRWIL